MEINLLPREVSASKEISRSAMALRKVVFALGGLFLLILISGGIFYFFSITSLNEAKEEYDKSVAEVESLQATEASLVFLKDRLQKADQVLSSRASEGNLAKQNELLQRSPQDVVFVENRVDASSSSIEIETRNSSSLVALMSTLISSSNFSQLFIDEFSFNANSGYSVIFSIF